MIAAHNSSFDVIYTGSETQPLEKPLSWRSEGGRLPSLLWPYLVPWAQMEHKAGKQGEQPSLLELGHPFFRTIKRYAPEVISWHRYHGHIALQPPCSHWLFSGPPA